MAKKHNDGYLSAKESRRISKENRRITNELEKKRKRKNVPETEYLTQMHDPRNAVEFDNLHTYFFTDTGVVKSVDGVTFSVPIGKTVGVVGESGCGKSVTSLSLMQLLQRPQGQVVEGEIRLNLGNKAYDVTKTPDSVMQHLRGNIVSMIFQEPMTALNPVFRIGAQLDEVIALHDGEGKTPEDMMQMALAGFAPNVLDERTVQYQCDCSAERTKEMLLSLGRAELARMRDEDPTCEVVCHFCHSKYQYDLNALLAEYDAQAAEAAQPADAVLVHGAGDILLHQFNGTITGGDIHTGCCVAFRIALFHGLTLLTFLRPWDGRSGGVHEYRSKAPRRA